MDLIITDIRMPKINGIELLETVRNEKLSEAYIIILSLQIKSQVEIDELYKFYTG